MPDLLSYLLTGKKVCEYTDASTSGLLNPATKEFEVSLLEAAGVAPSIMRPVVMPGTVVGELTDALARETGIGKVPVIAVAVMTRLRPSRLSRLRTGSLPTLAAARGTSMGIETEERLSRKNLSGIILRTKVV